MLPVSAVKSKLFKISGGTRLFSVIDNNDLICKEIASHSELAHVACLWLRHTRTSASPAVESPKRDRVFCRTSPRTNEPASIVWPGRITLVRVHPFCGDDLATHLLGNVSRYFLAHAHLLE